MENKEPELTQLQRPRVEAYCSSNGLSRPTKQGTQWVAENSKGETVVIPMAAYKPPFPG